MPVTAAAARPLAERPARISQDTLTTPQAQHASQVEPDTASFGSTVVAAFQVGRFFDGGASAIGYATSADAGRSWRSGLLPQLTTATSPPGTADRASDPVVAYDALHGRWLVASLALLGSSTAVVVSGSADGTVWDAPATAASRPRTNDGTTNLDKDWLACDNGAASPFRGRCYLAYTDFTFGPEPVIAVQSSSDGGLTWSAPSVVPVSTSVPGVQPVVRPSGELAIVFLEPNLIEAVRSNDGGATFSARETIAQAQFFRRAFRLDLLRAFALPSADVDRAGTIYVAWADCRFRRSCSGSDIVLVHSTATGWTAPRRIPVPLAPRESGHVLPGLAVDPSTTGARTHLAVTFYSLRSASCLPTHCLLDVRLATSATNGTRWTVGKRLNPQAMQLDWLPQTISGFMVGDYVGTSFAQGRAVGVFSLAKPFRSDVLNVAIHAVARLVR